MEISFALQKQKWSASSESGVTHTASHQPKINCPISLLEMPGDYEISSFHIGIHHLLLSDLRMHSISASRLFGESVALPLSLAHMLSAAAHTKIRISFEAIVYFESVYDKPDTQTNSQHYHRRHHC